MRDELLRFKSLCRKCKEFWIRAKEAENNFFTRTASYLELCCGTEGHAMFSLERELGGKKRCYNKRGPFQRKFVPQRASGEMENRARKISI